VTLHTKKRDAVLFTVAELAAHDREVRAKALEMLQQHEWDGGRLGKGQCPICSYEAYSHVKGCWLAAAIRSLLDGQEEGHRE